MLIHLHGEEKYIPVSTVTLQTDEGNTHPFHCTACGNTTNIIGGIVSRIYPILEPSHQITVITTCRSCKAKYTFQDEETQEKQPVVILLKPKSQMQYFYCYLGGGLTKEENKILEYTKGRMYSYANHALVHLPYTTRCSNPSCSTLYRFIV